MKLLGLIALVLLLATLLSPAGHRADTQLRHQRVAPVQIIRSPLATRTPKTVRRIAKRELSLRGNPTK